MRLSLLNGTLILRRRRLNIDHTLALVNISRAPNIVETFVGRPLLLAVAFLNLLIRIKIDGERHHLIGHILLDLSLALLQASLNDPIFYLEELCG